MIDETTDITNLEQVTIIIVMRRVDLTVYEEFLGFIMLIQLLHSSYQRCHGKAEPIYE